MKLVLTGWKPGLRKISLDTLLVKRFQLPLPDAVKHVEQLLKGELVELEINSNSNASDIAREMVELGVISHIEP